MTILAWVSNFIRDWQWLKSNSILPFLLAGGIFFCKIKLSSSGFLLLFLLLWNTVFLERQDKCLIFLSIYMFSKERAYLTIASNDEIWVVGVGSFLLFPGYHYLFMDLHWLSQCPYIIQHWLSPLQCYWRETDMVNSAVLWMLWKNEIEKTLKILFITHDDPLSAQRMRSIRCVYKVQSVSLTWRKWIFPWKYSWD